MKYGKSSMLYCIVVILLLTISSFQSVSAAEKKLYISEQDGILYYEAGDSANTTRFLTGNDMRPGKVYTDSMLIQNQTNSDYHIYLQMVSENNLQKVQEELLSMLHLKIYLGGKLLYDGTADGITKSGQSEDLSKKVSIGVYESGYSEKLTVKYYWDAENSAIIKKGYYVKAEFEKWKKKGYPKSMEPISYRTQEDAVIAAKQAGKKGITYMENTSYNVLDEDMKSIVTGSRFLFYAEKSDENGGDNLKPILPPKTGDSNVIIPYVVLLGISMFVIWGIRKKKKEVD